MNKELRKFIDKALKQFKERMTDNLFVMIQNDRELFLEWNKLTKDIEMNFINGEIAKETKKKFRLTDKNIKKKKIRNEKPKSVLIESFQEFNN